MSFPGIGALKRGLTPNTIVYQNISPESAACSALLTVASAKAAYDHPKQFLAVAAVAFTIGLARGYLAVKNHMQASKNSSTENQASALQRLNPMADRKTALYLITLYVVAHTKKGQEFLEKLPQIAKNVTLSHLVAIPGGYNLGVFVAREVVSRFVGTEGPRGVFNADCQRQKLETQKYI